MVKYMGINHLALVTSDMDSTIRFWRDLLHMKLVAGLGHPGYRHYFFSLTEHDMVAFFEWPDVEKLHEKDHGVPVKGPCGFDHVSFEVSADDDLWELKDRIEAAGFWVSEVLDHGFIHSIYTFDPNNIAIEFSAPTKRVDLRRKPRMMDRSPSEVTCEGPEPVEGVWPEVTSPATADDKVVYPGEGEVFDTDENGCF
ncbi:VOC family protein [Maridesulfovibrio bastinii]|uniref:VOC family protein n=1 Tax=Maridesulfovibrio bastinii TaxID=47157 RepID=UPI00041F2B34|nr:VOC family protein [Maridesulfovibrio bastinii]